MIKHGDVKENQKLEDLTYCLATWYGRATWYRLEFFIAILFRTSQLWRKISMHSEG